MGRDSEAQATPWRGSVCSSVKSSGRGFGNVLRMAKAKRVLHRTWGILYVRVLGVGYWPRFEHVSEYSSRGSSGWGIHERFENKSMDDECPKARAELRPLVARVSLSRHVRPDLRLKQAVHNCIWSVENLHHFLPSMLSIFSEIFCHFYNFFWQNRLEYNEEES